MVLYKPASGINRIDFFGTGPVFLSYPLISDKRMAYLLVECQEEQNADFDRFAARDAGSSDSANALA
jgi:hypothetical protein